MALTRFVQVVLFLLCVNSSFAASSYSLYVGNFEYDASFSSISESRILRVNPDTGASTIVASNTVGTGQPLYGVNDLIRAGNSSLYVAGSNGLAMPDWGGVLFRVDLATGNRTVVGGPYVGYAIDKLCLGGDGNILCLRRSLSNNAVTIDKINVTTGAVTTLASDTVGSGETYTRASTLVEESANSIIYHDTLRRLVRLNPTTLVRALIYTYEADVPPISTTRVDTWYLPGKLLVLMRATGQVAPGAQGGVVEDDLTTFQTATVAPNPDWGTEIPNAPHRVAQASDNVIYFTSKAGSMQGGPTMPGIYKINRSTGAASIVSSPTVGSGPVVGQVSPSIIGPCGLAIVSDGPSMAKNWQYK